MNNSWISVKDKLPKSGGKTFCFCFDSIFIADFDNEAGVWYGDQSGVDVEFWMPLPEPPKENK